MKKFILLLTLAFFISIGGVNAQSVDGTLKVLQACIDLPQLQDLYPKAEDNVTKQIYVMQHGISFPKDKTLQIDGYKIIYLDKSEIESKNISSYFLFWTFKINEKEAFVEFTYENNLTSNKVSLNLAEENKVWTVLETKIKKEDNYEK